jgi:hypothetical protein
VVSRAVEEDVRIAREVEGRLEKRDLSKRARAGFERFVSAQERIVRANTDQLAAARARDPVRFRASVDALLAATGESKRAADAYGLEGCPYVPVAVQLDRRSARRAAGGGASDATGVAGRWRGEVTQYQPGVRAARYPAVMEITSEKPGAVAGTIRYPTLRCGGEI